MYTPPPPLIQRCINGLRWLEDAVLVSLLSGMLLLAVTQILLRNGFDMGLVWADGLLRMMVMWIGLLGAMIAARDNRHVSIDLLTRYLPKKLGHAAQSLGLFFACAICALVAWHSGLFVLDERTAGTTMFSDLPAWWGELVLPLGFAVMALRFFLLAIHTLRDPVFTVAHE